MRSAPTPARQSSRCDASIDSQRASADTWDDSTAASIVSYSACEIGCMDPETAALMPSAAALLMTVPVPSATMIALRMFRRDGRWDVRHLPWGESYRSVSFGESEACGAADSGVGKIRQNAESGKAARQEQSSCMPPF